MADKKGKFSPEEYTVTFKKEALDQLRDAAASLDISDENLGEVIWKGIKLIQLAKESNGIVAINAPDEKLEVDLKKL